MFSLPAALSILLLARASAAYAPRSSSSSFGMLSVPPTTAARTLCHQAPTSAFTLSQQQLQQRSTKASNRKPLYADFTADLEASELPTASATAGDASIAAATASSSSLSWKQRCLSLMGVTSSEDGLTLRQRLTKMGVFAAMSYNVVSQVNSGSSMSIAWYFYSLRTGLSPLAPGQWKGYLAFYAGFWVVNNFLRPFRIAVALALAPKMERLTTRVQERCQMQKTKATTVTFVLSYVAALMYSVTCFATASLLSGVAIFP